MLRTAINKPNFRNIEETNYRRYSTDCTYKYRKYDITY